MTAQLFGSGSGDEVARADARSIWDQIAHERVKERLEGMFFRISLFGISRGGTGDAYREYSVQASQLRNSLTRVPSRELEDAVFALEDIA